MIMKRVERMMSKVLLLSLVLSIMILIPTNAKAENEIPGESNMGVMRSNLSEELLVNGGFEEMDDGKFLGWNTLNPTTLYASVTEQVYEGDYSAKLSDTGAIGIGLRSDFVPVKA